MELTIAICTYRRFDWLERCLDALEKQTLPQDQFKVVVVDNSLTPVESYAFKKSLSTSYECEYLITEKSGLSYARNIAISMCDTPYLGFLDDDAIAAPNWAEEIVNTFQRHEGRAGIVGGRVSPIWEKEKPEWLSGELLYPLTVLDWGEEEAVIGPDKWLVGANIAYAMRAVRKTPGFNESLGRMGQLLLCHEELALNQQIQQMGYSMVYTPKATVDHLVQKERMTQKWLCQQAFWEALSGACYYSGVSVSERLEEMETFFSGKFEQAISRFKRRSTAAEVSEHTRLFSAAGKQAASEFGIIAEKDTVPVYCKTIHIVTPSYNACNTIDATILSVVSQKGDFAIRYHVQDGGSTDGTVEKLAQWQKRLNGETSEEFPNIEVVFSYSVEPDNGTYDGVSKGFSNSKCHFEHIMGWINADDILLPNALADVAGTMDALPNAHWVCGALCVADESGRTLLNQSMTFPREFVREGLCDGKYWQMLQQEGSFWRNWLWDEVGGLNENLRYCGDWDLWRRFAHITSPYMVPWALGRFTLRKGQLSTQGDKYQIELNQVVNEVRRARAAEVLASKISSLIVPIVTVDPKSNNYNELWKPLVAQDVLGGGTTILSRMILGAKRTEKEEESVPHGRGPNEFHPNLFQEEPQAIRGGGKRPLWDHPVLHNVYLRSPELIRKTLTMVKYKVIIPVVRFPEYIRTWRRIKKSGLFFSTYYLKTNPDVVESGMSPLKHFILFGAGEGRMPNPLFDSEWYLKNNLDVMLANMNPLQHYIESGHKEDRSPSQEFSESWYKTKYQDVADAGVPALAHFLHHGIFEGRMKGCDDNHL